MSARTLTDQQTDLLLKESKKDTDELWRDAGLDDEARPTTSPMTRDRAEAIVRMSMLTTDDQVGEATDLVLSSSDEWWQRHRKGWL